MRRLDGRPAPAADRTRIDPRRLAFDIDGVVADTMRLFLDIGREAYRIEHLRYEDITGWNLSECLNLEEEVVENIGDRILKGNYSVPLRAVDGAVDVLTRIGKHCGSLLMVTARPHPGPIGQWLDQQLSLVPGTVDIVATGSFETKVEVLRERNMTHFVEDRLDTCFILHQAGLVPILFRQPWNRDPHPFIEVGSWAELEELIAY